MAPEQVRYRFLPEGDSWMERSSLFSPSLPDYLARQMDANHEDTLIINLAMFGDTMRRIGEEVDGQFAIWVRQSTYDDCRRCQWQHVKDAVPGAAVGRSRVGVRGERAVPEPCDSNRDRVRAHRSAAPADNRSRMPEHGVILSDGTESDYLRFTAGVEATVDLAAVQGRLVC